MRSQHVARNGKILVFLKSVRAMPTSDGWSLGLAACALPALSFSDPPE